MPFKYTVQKLDMDMDMDMFMAKFGFSHFLMTWIYINQKPLTIFYAAQAIAFNYDNISNPNLKLTKQNETVHLLID